MLNFTLSISREKFVIPRHVCHFVNRNFDCIDDVLNTLFANLCLPWMLAWIVSYLWIRISLCAKLFRIFGQPNLSSILSQPVELKLKKKVKRKYLSNIFLKFFHRFARVTASFAFVNNRKETGKCMKFFSKSSVVPY